MRGNPPPVPRLALALVLSAVAFLCICPGPRDPASPLPADMASHTLGAVAFADGVRHFDLPQLGRALLGADLYPPGHSVVQGSWILCFGDSPMSLWIFRWVLLFLSTIVVLQLASRSGVTGVAARIAAGAIWLASPFLLGLSATFLVEPAAILLLLASLLSIDALARNPKRRTLHPGFAFC